MPLLTHAEAHRIVGPHFGSIFDIITNAWTEYGKEYSAKQRAKHSTTTRASIIHDLTVWAAAQYFTEPHGGSSVNIQGLMLFTIEDRAIPVAIRFKKFDRQLLSRNQPTQQVRDFRSQRQIDALGAAYHLEAGYVLSLDESALQQISIVCPNGTDIYWDVELTAREAVTKVRDIFEPQPIDERVTIIRPKVASEKPKKSGKDEDKDQ